MILIAKLCLHWVIKFPIALYCSLNVSRTSLFHVVTFTLTFFTLNMLFPTTIHFLTIRHIYYKSMKIRHHDSKYQAPKLDLGDSIKIRFAIEKTTHHGLGTVKQNIYHYHNLVCMRHYKSITNGGRNAVYYANCQKH